MNIIGKVDTRITSWVSGMGKFYLVQVRREANSSPYNQWKLVSEHRNKADAFRFSDSIKSGLSAKESIDLLDPKYNELCKLF